MKDAIYFDHYRPAREYDGSRVQIGAIGAATLYKASDVRSGAPVVLTLLPVDQIAEDDRTRFEEKAQAARRLDHMNIVRTVEFGREGDDYAFVSEYPQGETLQEWVNENGPMAADAVLRVALQVVSALGAASFYHIVHRGIQPSNIVIVPGQTAEGGWPAVKLTNFPLAGLMTRGGDVPDVAELASPEQLGGGAVDFRSEVYSLGGTMCFLLTGLFYTAEPRSRQTKRFAGILRRLITPMLHQNPGDRPRDLMLVAQELRSCLQRVERRQSLARRFGIPFVAVSTRPMPAPRAKPPRSILAAALERPITTKPEPAPLLARTRRLWPRRALAVAAILLAAATVAAMLLPAPVGLLLHRSRDVETIGVPIGVAQTTASNSPGAERAASVSEPTGVAAKAASGAATAESATRPSDSVANDPGAVTTVEQAPRATSGQIVSANPPDDQMATMKNTLSSAPKLAAKDPAATQPPSPAEGPTDESSAASSARQTNESDNESTKSASEGSVKSHSSSKTKPATTTASRYRSAPPIRRAISEEPFSPDGGVRVEHPGMRGSVRAQVLGVMPDGGLVLRFPNGQTAVVPPPPGAYVPWNYRTHRPRRVIIERRPTMMPSAPYQPFLPGLPPDA